MSKIHIAGILLLMLGGIIILPCSVSAQEALLPGGDSLETATVIQPGSYQAGELPDMTEVFYSVQALAGQEINVKGVFVPASATYGTNVSITLYNEEKEEIIDGRWEDYTPSVSWLSNSSQDAYKYYIKISNDGIWGIESYSLEITLTDYFDAGSQKDAGDSFDKAIKITPGEHKAYLSGEAGADTKDLYKVAVKKGEVLTAKVTPPSEAEMEVVIYDGNRKILKDEYASNPGAIVTNSVSMTKSEDVFVGVVCDKYCSEELAAYTLDIATDGVIADEEAVVAEDEAESVSSDITGVAPTSSSDSSDSEPTPALETTITKTPNWSLILGIIAALVLVGLIIFFIVKKKKQPKPEKYSPSYLGGSKEANKPVVGYKHPCRYCEKLIPPDSSVCPFCGKENPLGPLRCPKCHNPVEKIWKTCSHCGLNLRIVCPYCGKTTFFSDYCEDCGKQLIVTCPHCKFEQPPVSGKCIKCGKSLKKPVK
jgi:hypothetical protein